MKTRRKSDGFYQVPNVKFNLIVMPLIAVVSLWGGYIYNSSKEHNQMIETQTEAELALSELRILQKEMKEEVIKVKHIKWIKDRFDRQEESLLMLQVEVDYIK